MILSSFFFTCKECFRFLISRRCYAHFDSQSAANMISDMVRSEISVQQLPFRSKVQLSKHHFKLYNVAVIDLDSFFALKSLRERLKGDFDDSKLIFFHFRRKFQFSHFNMLFSSFRQLERGEHEIRHVQIRNFGLVAAFQVLSLALKTSF